MDLDFKQLYELVYSPILTPYNLVDNAKLPNYDYVNYSKGEKGLIVSMKCELEEGFSVIFDYFFDKKDALQKLIMTSEEGVETLFDRQTDINKIKNRIVEKRNKSTSRKAI
jgi:hypothetical protein